MPAPRFIPGEQKSNWMGETLKAFVESGHENFKQNRESDALKEIYSQHEKDGQNLEKTIREIQSRPGISPATRVNTVNQLLQYQKTNQQLIKETNKKINSMTPEEKDKRKKLLTEEGLSENEAEEYLNATPGVQQIIWRQLTDQKNRGLKGSKEESNNPTPQPKQINQNDTVGNGVQPQDSELGIEDSFSNEAMPIDENAWPDIPAPPKMTPAEEVKWGNQNQRENNKLLAETRQKTNSTRGIGIRLNRLASLSEKIPDDIGRLVINPETGEPYPTAQLLKAGVSKETQDYVKTLNDFLIDAKAYFGSRVTNFDVQSFKSRLPSLLNSADGRRLIIKQMQLMNDLEDLHAVTLEDGLKHYGRKASYSDILSSVDNKVASREAEIIEKINNLDTASNYMDQMAKNPQKFKETVLMQNPEGKFKAIPKNNVNKALKKQWKVY